MPQGAREGQNDTNLISTRDEHGFVICKVLQSAWGGSLQAHTKFQKSIPPSWRAVVSFSRIWPLMCPVRCDGGQIGENGTTARHDGGIDF